MDEFDLTPEEEEEEMRSRFWEIVKKYRSTENDSELTPGDCEKKSVNKILL